MGVGESLARGTPGGQQFTPHLSREEGMRRAQKANSHCRGHAPWTTLSHSCSQPVTRLHPRGAEPRGIRKLQEGRTELPTLPCGELCLLSAAGAGPCPSPGEPSADSHARGVSRPFPPTPLLSSLQAVTRGSAICPQGQALMPNPLPGAEAGRASRLVCI